MYATLSRMKYRHRRILAWIALLGIAYSQWVLAVYACPLFAAANMAEHVAARGAKAGMPCAQMDAQQPLACAQHCHQGQQSVGAWVSFHFADAPTAAPIPALSLGPGAAAESDMQAPLLARATSPPPLSRSRRLRI